MKLIAHRGLTDKYIKENTIEAFDNALSNSMQGIEMDVRKTKDGKLVICHDAMINRTSDGFGLIRNYTYKELLKYNFGSNRVKSKIPLLKDVLKRYKCIKLVELKENIDISEFIDLIDENTYIMSFNNILIEKIKKDNPNIKCGVLNMVINSNIKYNLEMIAILEDLMNKRLEWHIKNKRVKLFIYGVGNKIDFKSEYAYYIVDKLFDNY